jgi:peptidoglycan/xylan/chitin deacetylase (PgdA/CDA1 family)
MGCPDIDINSIMFYLASTPFFFRYVYPECVWSVPVSDKKIFLTFDDGPHPEITVFVLDELKKYDAKATFFCIGNNVEKYPEVYNRIIEEGHVVANHTYNHLNGRKTSDDEYLEDIEKAGTLIKSRLFRPPYGSFRRTQLKKIIRGNLKLRPVMWSVLSGDFDLRLPKEKCLQNVLKHTRKGSIVVFHDSEKAREKMTYSLPLVLSHFHQEGYAFEALNDHFFNF